MNNKLDDKSSKIKEVVLFYLKKRKDYLIKFLIEHLQSADIPDPENDFSEVLQSVTDSIINAEHAIKYVKKSNDPKLFNTYLSRFDKYYTMDMLIPTLTKGIDQAQIDMAYEIVIKGIAMDCLCFTLDAIDKYRLQSNKK